MMPEQTAPADTTEPRPTPRSAAPTVARPTAEPADAVPADAVPADAVPADAVPADARPADRRIGAVSIAFLVIATIAGAVFAVLTPAFWGHDEITQFGRAYQVAHGGVFPQEIDDERGIAFGGDIPDSVDALMHYALNDYRDNPEEPLPMVASPDGYDRLESAPISETTTRMWFTNTAAYSPVAYLPAAAAIRTAEFLDLNVGGLLLLSRLSGVVVFVAVAGFAVNSLRRYRIAWLAFALALLPIAVFQAGTVTADTVTNALALLVSALFVKAVFLRDRLSKPETVVLLASAVLLPLCKPTYVLLALLVALVPAAQLGWTRRVRPLAPAAAAIGMILFLVWTRISARTTEGMGFMRPVDEWYSVIPAEQMSHVLGDPLNFVATFLQTMMIRDQLYFVQFFGELGFSYVDVPATAIVCAILAIVLAFGMSERLTATRVQAGATALAVLLSIGIIFGTLYLSFTPVGYYFIDGVQGRYFLPLALLACAVILRFIPLRVVGASGQPAVRGTSIAVVVLTVLSLLTTVARYYFTVWL